MQSREERVKNREFADQEYHTDFLISRVEEIVRNNNVINYWAEFLYKTVLYHFVCLLGLEKNYDIERQFYWCRFLDKFID